MQIGIDNFFSLTRCLPFELYAQSFCYILFIETQDF